MSDKLTNKTITSKKDSVPAALSPLDSANRLHHIDSLRGFALFGIFLVNMLAFQYGTFGYEYIYPDLNSTDQASHNMIEFLFQGSFYPIFSILFGFGATLMWQRAGQEDRPFYLVFLRRLVILAMMGTAHLYLIWDGDILLTYAITGFIFVLFLKCKPKTLLIWAITLVFLNTAPGLLPTDDASTNEASTMLSSIAEQEQVVLTDGSYLDTVEFRLTSDPFEEVEFGFLISIINAVTLFMQTLWLFIVGAIIAKKRWLHDLKEHKQTLVLLMASGLSVGIILKGVMVYTPTTQLDYIGYIFGGPVLGIGYIAAFSLLFMKFSTSIVFDSFRYVGRMALTNYISQSIVMTTLFYGYGFGLLGELGTTLGIVLVVAIFILQMILSKWWLIHYRFGPIEWLWRNGTYMKRHKIRKK
ncbi:DUF418 domain-containing protein [Salipaludibacillus sp. CF4.18]|uniref:DUF418 domain-containing protein n=1 Tax=Salipaludibacillus sp. CF4.18 TaxID=3373081 RepID=UPI003EE60ABB